MTDTLLNASFPIVDDAGTMEQVFRTWTLKVSNDLTIVGAGSPEGVVKAAIYSKYLDSTGSTGSLEYRKMLDEIGGDFTKGWVLV
jgi:hypothetical protein